jgi:dTDP-4-dehydrorhamnose 3,5-epimerase
MADMKIVATELDDVKLIEPARHGDHRGFFSEVYNRSVFASAGIEFEFIQDNHSMSVARGVLRGLHFQIPPFAQHKLVRVVRGAIRDVAVDIRRSSPTFGRHVSAILSAQNWRQVLVPAGFAHGFVTLEPNTEVIYKVSAPYAPGHERGLLWNDPALGIDWGVSPGEVVISDRDTKHPKLRDAVDLF